MSAHERFRYKSLDDFQEKIASLGLDIPLSDRLEILGTPVAFGSLTTPNRMSVHPMEGCDGDAEGRPGELTLRRYERFAAGGAGLLWLEACAVVPEGRANPRQIWINPVSVDSFKKLVDRIHAAARQTMGEQFRPLLVLQLTHSGRYSKPEGKPAPLIAHHSIIDGKSSVIPETPVLSDEYLDQVQEAYLQAARLAWEAGFDAVDVKACHRYLISELLASFSRNDSRYGGNFENRTRLLREVVARIKNELPGLEITSRLNVYDALAFPYGWGMSREGGDDPDLHEPLQLIDELMRLGYHGLNVTIGNPYYNPHFGRPFDFPIHGMYVPQEHPLETMHRFMHITRQVQQAYPDLTVIGSGYSWVRHFFPYIASAVISQGWASIVGLGRGAFAYPDFARDILQTGSMDPRKACVSCSACTQIMRDGGRSGCVVRDAEIYGPIFREGRKLSQDLSRELAAKCRVCATPACRDKCPAGVDIPGFISRIADGEDREAYRILRRSNPLPEICAHVCPVEVQCESACIEDILGDGSVPIRQLQKYAAYTARRQGWTRLELPPANGHRVAVVGAGPAGLACAVRLLETGFQVTLIDAAPVPGGTVDATIPASRMPKDILAAEIAALFDLTEPSRLEWRYNTALSTEYTLDKILADGYAAVFIGLGLSRAQLLDCPHPDAGVVEALEFLRRAKHGVAEMPQRVAVIGGGNSAMDAAVTAKLSGAEDVYLIYRRSFAELPAWPDERNRAVDAGVHFLILSQPVAYETGESGQLTAVRLCRVQLGSLDASGRRRPEVIEGSDYLLEVDLVVEAIGQQPPVDLEQILPGVGLTSRGLVDTPADSTRTTRARIYAGGDLVNGGGTAVEAVRAGVLAAEEILNLVRSPETDTVGS